MARLVTIDGEIYEVVDEAPGRTSMFLVNLSQKARQRIEQLEQLLADARADLAKVEASQGSASA